MAAENFNAKLIQMVDGADVPTPMCDEYRKMLSGMNFKACLADRMPKFKLDVRRQLLKFNDPSIDDEDTLDSLKKRRISIAKSLFGKLGLGTNIEAPLFCTWGCNTFIGKNVYINRDVSIFDSAPVKIGDRVLIGPGVCICTDTHEIDAVSRDESQMGSHAKPIVIGDNCWIGGRAIIVAGVTIGSGSTVAAGAVVVKDVEPSCLVGGVPAKLIRRLDDRGTLPE
ncbi:hypothetical protein DSL72_005867 [Monilinia vaccinii-corymbosi]|uniref:Mannose-1-phosphate guanylyltransferase n=1 Tax=Monilinia vaccinii-corymbosi TaxID=61207 RepID=A0A8A3PG96_9HELO|nr:hypothetical protein DSL72_005867 [Monilinia vaccinii-corymbosi]